MGIVKDFYNIPEYGQLLAPAQIALNYYAVGGQGTAQGTLDSIAAQHTTILTNLGYIKLSAVSERPVGVILSGSSLNAPRPGQESEESRPVNHRDSSLDTRRVESWLASPLRVTFLPEEALRAYADLPTVQPDIQPGDQVTAQAAGLTTGVHFVGTISTAVDADSDTVAGTIRAAFTETLRVRGEVWVENGPDGIETTADPDGGSYACDFGAAGWDLRGGQEVAVRYFEPDGDSVINVFTAPWRIYLPLILRANSRQSVDMLLLPNFMGN